MSEPLTIECDVHFQVQARGRKRLHAEVQAEACMPAPERVPRVAKLLALAHRFERLLRDGGVRDYSELGRLGHVTRARVSQIMSLLLLAPDIQEEILFLPPTTRGRDRIQMRHLLPIAALILWSKQRTPWADLRSISEN